MSLNNSVRPSRKHDLLLTPTYLVSLLLLLLNDLYWKNHNPSWITGKLSDFSGLFCLAIFLSVLLPNWSVGVNIGLGILFCFWKSPYADVVINQWNALSPYHVARVIDYTDFFALLILPVAHLFYSRTETNFRPNTAITIFVLFLSCFAFLATSRSNYENYDSVYSFAGTKAQFVEKLKASKVRISDLGERDQNVIQFDFHANECFEHIGAKVHVLELNGSTEVRLTRLFISCSKKGGEQVRLLKQFESFSKKIGLERTSQQSP
jgi:hypothetical protein